MHPSELKAMLIMAQSRGSDSTGVATKTEILKKAEEAKVFTQRELPTDDLVIGHTRFGTVGRVCDRNSHPFKFGDVVGVHNGGISNFRKLANAEKVKQNVDSEIIWTMIDRYGVEEGLPKLTGSLALAWIQDEKLHLYRHGNPCYIGWKKDDLYFGSEESYLGFLECQNIEQADRHTYYIIDQGEIIHKEKLENNPSYTTYARNQSWRNKRNSGRRPYPSHWQKKHNGDKTGIQRHFPPNKAPSDANYVYHNDNYVVYFWFNDDVVSVEPVYPNMDYNFVDTGSVHDPDFINTLKEYNNKVYKSETFQNKLEELTQN